MQAKIITTLYRNDVVEQSHEERVFQPDTKNQEQNLVNLYPDITYQTLEVFGGAITEAVGITLSKVSSELADTVIKSYFGTDGIGYRAIRTHLDSCDFSSGNYSAVEEKEDADFTTFNLKHDEKNIIPYIKAACSAAGESLPVILSPWSPPAYMKSNGNKNGGGKLKKEYYELWAQYICRYIKEYQKRGINVKMLSVQNEPNAVQSWDSCIYTPEEEKDFLKNYLVPQLEKSGLNSIELYIWDHNKERIFERAKAEIDETTDAMIDGLAFHWYSGDHFDALRLVREKYPDKKLLFSEGCIEYSRFDGSRQLQNAQMYAHDMIGNLNAGMNTFIDWNIVLDEQGGPNHAGNYCEAPIICDTKEGKLYKKLSYYYIAHFSKYIKPGAKRIASTKYTSDIEVTAFYNADEALTVVLLNRTAKDMTVVIRLCEQLLELTIGKESISTVIINK